MQNTIFQIVRIAVVIALVVISAVVATPKGRLPLAVRGLARVLRRDMGPQGQASGAEDEAGVGVGRRIVAFVLIVLAVVIALA